MESLSRSATSLSAYAAEEVRVLLVRRKMKQTELAARLGVTEMWLSRRLRGVQPLTLDELAQIAEALGVYPTDLLPRPSEGRLITTAATRQEPGAPPNGRSGIEAERPTRTGPASRTQAAESTRRPARTRPSSTR